MSICVAERWLHGSDSKRVHREESLKRGENENWKEKKTALGAWLPLRGGDLGTAKEGPRTFHPTYGVLCGSHFYTGNALLF